MKLLALLLTPLGLLLRRKRAGSAHSIRNAPELATSTSLELTSPSFAPGGTIPLRHATMDLGPNISPALAWSDPPAGTTRMLLVLEDIDVPIARPGRHMIAFFDPEPAHIGEGELTSDNPRFTYLPVHRGRTGYQGPRPLPGHGVHHYTFHLYALDTEPAGTGLDDLLPQLAGHVLASGHLEGTLRG
ncbi:YbhB/YbcL family Raf kinase inhibitor-like protein [Actinoallomurus iriomotensis]|uniref:Phosphatidylethanolamine-binding protein n=1 Tax=Actinoallomurus iriomotensis TaxID=478107 RepID=A0A9W6S516_9ACTN|nr:YbhB/YbcL family Raf kinase inhibitor-like protein [Actinoallomurus iriomotensis]GLY88410.1 phosphatidylethanolamine-binding protein [Actinoallomurus iriomotensis]